MRVLVAYASRHGATAGIAERIAARMREKGVEAQSLRVDEVDDVAGYEAYVVGSAAYMFHWLKEATSFAKKHHEVLAAHPTWLFSSGPLGTELVDDEGRDIFEVSRPREFDDLHEMLNPMGEHVFFGAWDPDAPPKGMAERMFRLMPVSKEVLPAGDFRDWEAIDSWADEIVAALGAVEQTKASTPGRT